MINTNTIIYTHIYIYIYDVTDIFYSIKQIYNTYNISLIIEIIHSNTLHVTYFIKICL